MVTAVVCITLLLAFTISVRIAMKSPLMRELGGWFNAAGAAQQHADALSVQLRNLQQFDELRDWAIVSLDRFDLGTLTTNGPAVYWAPGQVAISSNEIPPIVARTWPTKRTNAGSEPTVTVLLTSGGKAQAISISWYLSGIVLGRTNYSLSFTPWYSVRVCPGVYVYALEK